MSSARKELYATIEQQNLKISTYETKISDLIKAYKSLQREKKALQLTLETVVCSPSEQDKSDLTTAESGKEDLGTRGSEESKSEEVSSDTVKSEIIKLQKKVATLTAALQTLAAEKNLTESSLREDRKRLLEDKKKIEDQLKYAANENEKLKNEYEGKLQDLKTRIIVSQHEREQDTSNGTLMLREVESRLSKERNERERLEKLLDEIKEQNRQWALALAAKNHDKKQQKQITDLQNELEQVRCRLKKAEQQCEEPPILKKLHEQMDDMKEQYMAAVLQEQLRAEAAENSAKELSQMHEERVAALEARLTELSFTAANYDRTKQTHLHTIHILKEKIAELSEANWNSSLENSSEISNLNCGDNARNTQIIYSEEKEAVDGFDMKMLLDKFSSLWDKIQSSHNCEVHSCIEELFRNDAIIHKICSSSFEELQKKHETLKAKLRKETRSMDNNDCTCDLKEQLVEALERIRSMNLSHHTIQTHHNQQVVALNEDIKHLRSKYEEQIRQLQQDNKAAVSNLEQQLMEHCQRSLVTLQDRDEEIHRLIQEIHKLNKEVQIQPSTVAAALLSQVNTGGGDGPLLHHLEELARKDLEVSKLLKEKIILEKSMRDIQMNAINKQQDMQDAIDDLTELIDRLQRNASREGENLEYLKNVVLQYMTTYDVDARQLILKAIAAILKFTEQETEGVKKCLSLWWWQASSSKTKSQDYRIASLPSTSSSGMRGRYLSDAN